MDSQLINFHTLATLFHLFWVCIRPVGIIGVLAVSGSLLACADQNKELIISSLVNIPLLVRHKRPFCMRTSPRLIYSRAAAIN